MARKKELYGQRHKKDDDRRKSVYGEPTPEDKERFEKAARKQANETHAHRVAGGEKAYRARSRRTT